MENDLRRWIRLVEADRDPYGPSADEDHDPRYRNDGVFSDDDHKVRRDQGAWGSSHGTSRAIAQHSVERMGGVDNPNSDGLLKHANGKLAAIFASQGSKEPLYHGFQNRKHIDWKIGQTLTLPLTATSGDLQSSAGYGVRLDIKDNEGPPTVFEFPKGTKLCGYSKWKKADAEDFGYLWAEAIVAGKFRIVSVRSVQYDGSWRKDLFLTVVRLAPVAYFNPETNAWVPS